MRASTEVIPGGDVANPNRVVADRATADILFVMTGATRDAEEYQADPFDAYNLGNLVDGDGQPNPRDQWSFTIIDALFDRVVADVHSHAQDFLMYGHSAGAQFVHRFLEFTPNRVRAAVAANAGWYTMPDCSAAFPYGLRGVTRDEDDLAESYSANFTVLLGADDVDGEDRLLRHDSGSDAQGATRLERGLSFYLAARKSAEEHSLAFRWRLVVVPGIAHDRTAMARSAAPFLLGGTE